MAEDSPYKWYDVSSPEALVRTAKRGAYWFYWIAALSLINTLLAYGGVPIRLALGLAITQLIDALVAGIFPGMYYISLAIDVVIAALFVGFGYLSGRGEIPAFIAGLILYVCDALLYLLFMLIGRTPSGVVALIWHGVACYFLWKGLQAARELASLPPEKSS